MDKERNLFLYTKKRRAVKSMFVALFAFFKMDAQYWKDSYGFIIIAEITREKNIS